MLLLHAKALPLFPSEVTVNMELLLLHANALLLFLALSPYTAKGGCPLHAKALTLITPESNYSFFFSIITLWRLLLQFLHFQFFGLLYCKC